MGTGMDTPVGNTRSELERTLGGSGALVALHVPECMSH